MNCDISWATHRTFWRKRLIATLDCSMQVEAHGEAFLHATFQAALSSFFSDNWLLQSTLINHKGRDSSRPPTVAKQSFPSKNEELLFVVGSFIDDDVESEDADALPYSLQALTQFKDFPDGRTIRYGVDLKKSDTLPEWITPYGVLHLNSVSMNELRLSMERFGALFSGLGYSPTVRERWSFEGNSSTALLHYHSEDFNRNASLFTALSSFLEQLDTILGTSLVKAIEQHTSFALPTPAKGQQ